MKVEWEGEHPDEGSIHAWLDGELDASEAALLDEHVRGCAECGVRVAEARGLAAGASRVIGQLDAAPARLIQPATTPTMGDNRLMWRLMRVTPARASIAAALLVAVGITLTRSRVSRESELMPPVASAPASSDAMTAMAASKEDRAPAKDNLLDSAISRKLANEQPPRTLEPAAGGAIPQQDVAVMPSMVPDRSASLKVAAARASLRARVDSATPPADRARVGFSAGAPATLDRMSAAGQAAEVAADRKQLSGKVAGVLVAVTTASQCFLVESPSPGAQWGTVTLPMVLAFDSVGTTARVLTTDGADTEMRAVRVAGTADSLTLRLRRIGYNGTLALSGTGDARPGVMRSIASQGRLESVVVTSTGTATERRLAQSDTRANQPAPAAPQPALKKDAPAQEAEKSMGAAVGITAHLVSCQKR